MDMNNTDNLPASIPGSPISDLGSSDSETCNTSTSRVHFGPVRSPEKRFFATGHHQQAYRSTSLEFPVQQSPQSSMSGAPLPVHAIEQKQDDIQDSSDDIREEDEPSRSRSGTPENDRLYPDEPSSILATRIMRAHDNPSPPPRTSGRLAQSAKDAVFPQIGIWPPSPPSPNAASVQLPEEQRFPLPPESPSPSPSPFLCSDEVALPALFRDSITLSPSPRRGFGITGSQDGPIALDSSAPPTAHTLRLKISPIADLTTISEHHNGQSPVTSIDNLLSQTRPGSVSRGSSQEIASMSRPSTLLDNGESKVAVGTPRCVDDQASSSSSEESTNAVASLLDPSNPVTQDRDHLLSPVRRSTRPRRSVSPFTVNGSAVVETRLSTPVRQGSPSVAPFSGAQTQKKKKQPDRGISPASLSNLNLNLEPGSQSGLDAMGSAPLESTQESTDTRDEESPKRKGKRRDVNGSQIDDDSPHRRQLVSLSPSSAGMLTQLIPSANASPVMNVDMRIDEIATITNESPRPPILSFPAPSQRLSYTQAPQGTSSFQSPIRSGSHVRFTSPTRSAGRQSPAKVQPMDLDDPNRTPARRIPLEQAVSQGQISLQKAMQLASKPPDHPSRSQALFPTRTPLFPLRPEMRSPARRIPVSESTPVKSRGPKSPIRAHRNERSRSVEPKPLETGLRISRSASVDHPNSSSMSTFPPLPKPIARPQLPYPLTSTREPTIPEVTEPQPSSNDRPVKSDSVTVTHTSPAKSTLRQSSTASRIPRISVKPYAKTAAIAAATTSSRAKESRRPGIMRRVDLALNGGAGKASGPSGIIPVPGESGNHLHSSNVVNPVSSLDVTDQPTAALSGRNLVGPSTSPLKRKRGTEPVTSPVKGATARMPQGNTGQLDAKYPPGRVPRSPVKKTHAPLFSQKVVDHRREAAGDIGQEEFLATPNQLDRVCDAKPDTRTQQPVDDNGPSNDMSSLEPTEPSLHLGSNTTPPDTETASVENIHNKDSDSIAPSLTTMSNQDPRKARRATRSRKPVTSTAIVNVFESVDRSRLQRRKAVFTSFRENDVFSCMSAVALRAITSSNTTKNQNYWATKLETEVIRKEGSRPESPTVKVKTTMQRQEEERARQRQERADRRARRSDDGSGYGDTEGFLRSDDSMMTDTDTDMNELGARGTEHLFKHQRGPGDEEDYESPDRTHRPAKRPRAREDDIIEEKKRVKWDRSLSTAVFVDEVQPQPRLHPRGNIIIKGCLAKTAKTIRLDNLGNLPNADSPLTDLVHENIIVKKFVYDNDPEPEPAQVLTTKNTRSRSKKTKS